MTDGHSKMGADSGLAVFCELLFGNTIVMLSAAHSPTNRLSNAGNWSLWWRYDEMRKGPLIPACNVSRRFSSPLIPASLTRSALVLHQSH